MSKEGKDAGKEGKETSTKIADPFAYFVKTECTELTLGLYDGLRIAIKCWGNEHAPVRILVRISCFLLILSGITWMARFISLFSLI